MAKTLITTKYDMEVTEKLIKIDNAFNKKWQKTWYQVYLLPNNYEKFKFLFIFYLIYLF